MVMVITFLTLTNIALGYGLAVYVNRNFGTLILALPKKQKATPVVKVKSSETVAAVATPSSQPTAQLDSTPEQVVDVAASQSVPEEHDVTPATEIAAIEPVDEENVLAGIEEFRSQLAKMSASAEPITAEPQLVGAAN